MSKYSSILYSVNTFLSDLGKSNCKLKRLLALFSQVAQVLNFQKFSLQFLICRFLQKVSVVTLQVKTNICLIWGLFMSPTTGWLGMQADFTCISMWK